MTTIPDSISAQLTADWAVGTGGVEPTYYVSEDFRTNPPLGKDGLWIPTETLKTDVRPVNDTYANHNHTIDLIVNTIEDEDRLKELADEVVRILNATAITDMTYQRITNRKRVSGDYNGIWVYQEIITVDMREQMATSASAYGAGAGTNLDDLLMYGSAHAAWMPCVLYGGWDWVNFQVLNARMMNVDATDFYIMFQIPKPTNMGSLKLHVDSLKFGMNDADATNYCDNIELWGANGITCTEIDEDLTNHNSVGDKTWAIGDTDLSSYQSVYFEFYFVVTNANAMDITNVRAHCWYE